MDEFTSKVKPGDPITAAAWNRLGAVANRFAGARAGGNMAGMNTGSAFSWAGQPSFRQGLVEVKEQSKNEDEEAVDGEWVVRLRWYSHNGGEWKTDGKTGGEGGGEASWSDEGKDWLLDAKGLGASLKVGDLLCAFWDAQRQMWVPAAEPIQGFRVRNDTGGDLTELFKVVGLSGPIHEPGTSEGDDADADFKADSGDMRAVLPEFPAHIQKWAITLEPIKSGEVGRAAASGVVPVRVDMSHYPRFKTANIDPLSSTTDHLVVMPYGRAEGLWAEDTGGGIGWAIVNLGIIRTPLFPVVLAEDLSDGGPALCDVLLPDGSAVDDTADQVLVNDSLKVAGAVVSGTKAWVFANPDSGNYELLGSDRGGSKLAVTTSYATWHEGTKTPPSVHVKLVKWSDDSESYEAFGGEHVAWWPQATRDDAGRYVCSGRLSPSLLVYVKWVSQDGGEGSGAYSGWWEIVDGLQWSGVVKLYGVWDYTYETPQGKAKFWYYDPDSGQYTSSSTLVTLRNPITPRTDGGEFIRVPIGYGGELYSAECGSDGQYTVTGPRDVLTICSLRGQFTYPDAADRVATVGIRIYGYNGTKYVAVANGDVTGYWVGFPRHRSTGTPLKIPEGPSGGGGSTQPYQYGLCRWYAAKNRWEVLNVFNPQSTWRGRLKATWTKPAAGAPNASVGVTVFDVNDSEVNVTLEAKGWGFPDGTSLPSGTDVMLFYLPDDGELWFMSSGSSVTVKRGKLDHDWSKPPVDSAHVTFEPEDQTSGETGADAFGWGFGDEANLPSGHEVTCFYLDKWYFIASADARVPKRGYVMQEWIAEETGEIMVGFQDEDDFVVANGWGYQKGANVPYEAEVWLFQVGDEWYFISDTPGPKTLYRGKTKAPWNSGNDGIYVEFVDEDRDPVTAKGWGYQEDTHLKTGSEVILFQAGVGGVEWFFISDTPGSVQYYRGWLKESWSGQGNVSCGYYKADGTENPDPVTCENGWGFDPGTKLSEEHEVWIFKVGEKYWFSADTAAGTIYRGKLKAPWSVTTGGQVGVALLDPPGHDPVDASGWGYRITDGWGNPTGIYLATNTEVWVRQVGSYWFFWSDAEVKQVWQGKLNAAWAKPPGGAVNVVIENGGLTRSATGWGYESGTSLPKYTEVTVYRTAQGYFFCSAHSPGGDRVYRGKLNIRWIGQEDVIVNLQDEQINDSWQVTCKNGWGYQTGSKDLPQGAEVWVAYAGTQYWFWSSGSGAGSEVRRATTVDKDWDALTGGSVELAFEPPHNTEPNVTAQ